MQNSVIPTNMDSQQHTLCFKENEFLEKNFSVDKFVAKSKDLVPMNTLREDLESHYKSIQLSLIELINRDYADFVSLSSNLIGTDKTINNLATPLGQFKEEIKSVKGDLSKALDDVDKKLEQRRKIREKKARLHHLINVVHSVEKIEKILTADPKSPDMEIFMNEDRTHPGHFLERIAGEFNQLQFHVNQSKGHPVIESIRPRVALITSKLQENLESTFEQGILQKDSDLVLRCLRTYALIDKTSHAEEMFRHIAVKPFVNGIINEQYLDAHGLDHICMQLLDFVRDECRMMISLTSPEAMVTSDSSLNIGVSLSNSNLLLGTGLEGEHQKQQAVKGFDFLVNSVWVEIVQAFEESLPLIFSPGNPDSFLSRYKTMMKFLDDFEDYCTSPECFKALRSHPSYNSFLVKWSLPVYFQIRFQEIGGSVEMAVDKATENSPEGLFLTNIVGTCWQAIKRCWSDEIYISPLKGRFWKLTLQITNRLVTFVRETAESQDVSWKIEDVCLLLGDTCYMIRKLKEYYKAEILNRLRDNDSKINEKSCSGSLEECCQSLAESSNLLTAHLVTRLSKDGVQQLENVNNVPRLYRRTNKECPTTPSAYVSSAFASLQNFKTNSSTLDVKQQSSIISQSVDEMLNKYFASVDELLTSIKKTEDSLLRLKQQRKAAAGQSSQLPQSKSGEMSDENKIRQQIFLDGQEFGKQMESIGVSTDHGQYVKLKDVTTKAMQITTTTE